MTLEYLQSTDAQPGSEISDKSFWRPKEMIDGRCRDIHFRFMGAFRPCGSGSSLQVMLENGGF
ncbi:hypothetical protein [Rhizobium sp. CCGE 510]|uniref:hypothetical protein n=1 Tax=Rhizobium sp. CCGE 510 TaxID=1132836 RepID=UPI0003055619|nr:hypothetical protein [Rhizobium sp. CCGE 510]